MDPDNFCNHITFEYLDFVKKINPEYVIEFKENENKRRKYGIRYN